MAEMLPLDSLKKLRTVIDQQHLLYLEFYESPLKIKGQRDRLENHIREYLYKAPHDSKFMFQQTAQILHQSASTKSNFSAYKAAVAWKAIGKYADNLIAHPWRKEYRDIKLYCGFFKHEIEDSLVGAELMFEAMGYRHSGPSSMTLPGILDPDRITSVSKDAIVAFVECQIMKQIWETLSTHFNITWLDILEFRESHTGTAEEVICLLPYKYRLRHYQDQPYHRPQQIRPIECNLPHAECFYAQHSVGYYNHVPYPGPSCSLSVHSRCGPVVNSQHLVPTSPVYPPNVHPSYVHPNVLKPQDMYTVNGYYAFHQHYSTPYTMPHSPHNGFSGMPVMCPAPSVVPTGQLIELESSPTHNKGDAYFQRFSKFSPHEESIYHPDSLKDDGPSLTGKAKDDGAGSWENWDYVYRNLESQGYTKDSHESHRKVPLKGSQSSSSQNNSSDDIDSLIQAEFSDKIRKIKICSNSQSKGETSSSRSYPDFDEVSKAKNIKEKKAEFDKAREPLRPKTENKTLKISPEKIKKVSNAVSSKSSSNKQKENESLSKENFSLRRSKEDTKPLIVNLDDAEEKWQCVTCTYLNSNSKNVCEMCYKSKERGSELNPQPSGGQECPQCTLVNEPGLNYCAACTSSLKDSPTYI